MIRDDGVQVGVVQDVIARSVLRPHMPELDTVRGLAVTAVVAYHMTSFAYDHRPGEPLPRKLLLAVPSLGYLGVQLFFVLSGFLITGILLDGKSTHRPLRRFYERRALRILPAFAMILVAVSLLRATSGWQAVAASAFFLANVLPLLHIGYGYGVLWSLAVEEHFYLIWPTITYRLSMRSVGLVAAGIVIGSPVLRWIAFGHVGVDALNYYTWFNLDGLALGAVLAVVVRHPAATRRHLRLFSAGALGTAAVVAGLGLPFGITTRHRHVGAALFLTVACLAFVGVITATLLVGSGPRSRFVNIRLLRWLGLISYGLYLVHQLVFDQLLSALDGRLPSLAHHRDAPLGTILLRLVVAVALAVAIAVASRFTIESWFLRRGRRDAPAETLP